MRALAPHVFLGKCSEALPQGDERLLSTVSSCLKLLESPRVRMSSDLIYRKNLPPKGSTMIQVSDTAFAL